MGDALVAALRMTRGELAIDIELVCPPGITVIMGPSGAGKSSVLAVLAGLATPDVGTVELAATTWLDTAKKVMVPTHRRQLAYVFQGLALFPHLNAIHNVTYGMDRAIDRAERVARAHQLLDKLGVGHLAKRRPRTFSGGEAQRVALARALARSPRLLLLDEPFSALDRDLRTQLTRLVRELADELAVPVVHVTHSIAEARALADQVIRVEHGKVASRGSAADVLGPTATSEQWDL